MVSPSAQARELLLALSLLGCGTSATLEPPPEPPPQEAVVPATAAATAAPAASGAPVASAPPPAPGPRFPGGRFPPADFAPPHERSAEQGDGRWVKMGGPDDRAGKGEAVLYTTVVHPHPVSRFDQVHVVAIDLERLDLHFMPGSQDPGVDGLEPPAGLVPEAHRKDLVAVFNGGWLPRHGNWGMMVGGKVLVPPREEGCTVALYQGGGVRIGSWPALAGDVPDLRAYRQIPPCMVEGGALHPLLEAHNERPWGGRDPKRKTRRRSSIGLDASGRVLLYGFGVEVGPELLARGMKHAGAVALAELDINWSWTRFLLFGESDGKLRATSTLVPKMTHTKRSYVERREERDFFYLVRR